MVSPVDGDDMTMIAKRWFPDGMVLSKLYMLSGVDILYKIDAKFASLAERRCHPLYRGTITPDE